MCPGTSSIRLTLKRFLLSDPSPCHAGLEDVIVLLTSILQRLDQTLSAAGVNTYLRTTVKLLDTTAKSVSLKSLRHVVYTIWEAGSVDDFHVHVSPIYFSGTSCSGFQCSYTCGCGQPISAHQTLVSGIAPLILVALFFIYLFF